MNKQNKLRFLLSPWTILVAVTLGAYIGHTQPKFTTHIAPCGHVFLDLLKMCVIPLLITALSTSLARILKKNIAGRLLIRLCLFFIASLLIMSAAGIVLGQLTKIGKQENQAHSNQLGQLLITYESQHSTSSQHTTQRKPNYTVIPDNIFSALSDGQNLPIVTFSILFGLAMGIATSRSTLSTLRVLDGLFDTFLTLINGIIYLIPFGLFALVADQVAHSGFGALFLLSKLLLTLAIASLFMIACYTYIIAWRTNTPYFQTLHHLRQVLIIAFITTSSFAALPFAIQALEQKLKLNKDDVNLIYPLGIALNPQGSAMFFALVTVFIANLYGMNLNIGELLIILFGSAVVAIAVGGIPAIAGFSMLAITFNPLGLPVSTAVILLISVAHFIDPIFTVVNVMGNCLAVSLLAKRNPDTYASLEEAQPQI